MIPDMKLKGNKDQWAVLFLGFRDSSVNHEGEVFADLSGRRMADGMLNAFTVRTLNEKAGPH